MIKTRPFVSVIVPAKNEAKLLPLCLSSLRKQSTTVPYEIVVVDGTSTDNTRKIARSFHTTIVTQKHKGKVYGILEGARAAKGTLICFTEADCVVPPDWIDRIVTHFDTHPDTAALCGIYTFRNSTWLFRHFVIPGHVLMHTFNRLYFGHHTLRASNFAVRRDAYARCGGISPDIQELYDLEISHRLAKYGSVDLRFDLVVQTSDRRVRGRVLSYIRESFPAVWARLTHQPFRKQTYEDLR